MSKLLALSTAALVLAGAARADGEKPFDLMIGDAPPALSVAEWIKGEPVAGFEKGQTYVVEFWATWCGPCRKAIPHVSKLQQSYGSKVRFIGVSIWEDDVDKVGPFVEKMGDDMAYTVARDRVLEGRDGAMSKSWMEASGQAAIPSAFVIDADGRVAWIGHPMSIDEPLAQIVAGEWDRAAAAATHAEAMALKAAVAKVRGDVSKAMKSGAYDQALAKLDAAFAEHPQLEREFATQKFLCLLKGGRTADCSAYGNRLVDGLFKDDPGSLNYLAWSIVDPDAKIAKPDLVLAKRAAQRGCELTEWKEPAILDTYALALFLSGDVKKAVDVQEKAVEHSIGTPFEAELKGRLKEFRERLEGGSRS